MTARKLQQEIDKCFKKVDEGVAVFEGIYEKIVTSSNPSQKEKLEDALKKEIKKLQRQRDQIKGWAAQNDIKDKKPLQDKRKLIETQMEKFKAVEKEMKTKAYSKEGLSAAAKLDPKEKEKYEMVQFVSNMVEELERQIEQAEAELETLQGTVKKGKKGGSNNDRISELEQVLERHKWHQNKLEQLLRALENGDVETEQVKDAEEGIRYYVENNQEVDFMEDDTIYDDFNLVEGEDIMGMNNEVDRVSSQDAQSVQEETPEPETKPAPLPTGKHKQPSISESTASARRPSMHMRSPLPALATLNAPVAAVTNGAQNNNMRPAPAPARAPGEPLKYASAAAAAAAGDKGIGIAPLPPPPGARSSSPTTAQAPAQQAAAGRRPSTTSPATTVAQPILAQRGSIPSVAAGEAASITQAFIKSPATTHASAAASSIPPTPAAEKAEHVPYRSAAAEEPSQVSQTTDRKSTQAEVKALTNGARHKQPPEEESIYHLPSNLQDLLDAFEATKSHAASSNFVADERQLAASHASCPKAADSERPNHYTPENPYPWSPTHYPQEPLPIFHDQALYNKVDPDVLFYAFYYRQGTYQQYLAAQALKQQSWRFHKQYQTWFQRHEEPKTITEEFEQGTYRFFDYESTWMNRRKQDFKFHYRWLEDDLQ